MFLCVIVDVTKIFYCFIRITRYCFIFRTFNTCTLNTTAWRVVGFRM